MWLSVFYILGTLLAFSVCSICPETSEDAASWVKLKPLGHCGDEEDLCPFQLTLPPLSIQLPIPFRELEKMAKELQNLKEVVHQLRRDCQECKDRHSVERDERTDHSEEEENTPQSHNINSKATQSGEQVFRMLTSALLQGDTSESDGTAVKRLDHSILEGQEWTTHPRTALNQGTAEKRAEMSREVKVFNPSVDQMPDNMSSVTQVPTLVEAEKELMPKQSELIEQSLPRKKDDVQLASRGKQQPNVLRNGQVKNISDILKERRRGLTVPHPKGLSSISTDANTKTKDLGTPAGNKRIVKVPKVGGQLRPKGSYINGRGVSVNNGDRPHDPALVRKTQSKDLTIKTDSEEAGFSPARSGVMRVKETSQIRKPGATGGLTPLTDQNKQDFRVSGPKTDDYHNLRNKTEITRLPTNLRKEKQGIVSTTAKNTSISSVKNQAEQPNTVTEERKHEGLSESLVVINSETETSTTEDTEDFPFSGRQVENEKYLNPISDTNNGQIDSTILDAADSTFNARTANPLSTDISDKMQPETFIEGAKVEIGFNLLSAETEKKDILSNTKATLLEKDLVKPTIVPTAKSKRTESTVSMSKRVQPPVVRRISLTPLTTKVSNEQFQNNKKNVSMTRDGNQYNIRYVMPNPTRNPETHPTSVIIPRGSKLRPNIMNKMSENRSVGVPKKLSISVRNSNITRKNGSGIINPTYLRTKPNFNPEPNRNRGVKTKVSTVIQFFSPTGATSTVEKEDTPQVITSNVLGNPLLKNNKPSKSQHTESQNASDVQGLVQEGMNRTVDNSETAITLNIENSAEAPNPRETSNSPTGVKEKGKKLSLLTADINSEHPSEPDQISSRKKRPNAPTLKKELSKQPGTSQVTTSTVSFIDTGHDDSTKKMHTLTTKHGEMAKNLSRDASVSVEKMKATPNRRLNVLDNQWLKNNSDESKSQPEPATAMTSKTAQDPNALQSGASNSPTGGKESKISTFRAADTSSQFQGDKISSVKKRPTASSLNKELSKKTGTTQLTTSTVSFTETDPEDIHTVTNTRVEMKNVSRDTPISFENIGVTRELELIKLKKDRVEENPGGILSNPNIVDTANGYIREKNTIPVVTETLTNVEEIKGLKLFSLSPEDTAEGFKSHDEVTEREKDENKIHSTCVSDCNTTSAQHSQPNETQTGPPLDSSRDRGPAQDCSDYITKSRRNGLYRVTPHPKNNTFPVFCDLMSSGGGWTLIQHRFDGSTSFNRTWDDYKKGFGKLLSEFWLGNDKIHLLTKAKNMSLRIEIEDFEGIREYAHYDHFSVANESQQYRLSIGGYSGTAGDAMQFSKKYNHDQKLFTTPDRDNDQYPSGNCGAYYSSGWWFDACMSANLNGKYYQSKYKGVRNGIFWGTWHNITMEYYPTNDRQSFKTVKMMIRPQNYTK